MGCPTEQGYDLVGLPPRARGQRQRDCLPPLTNPRAPSAPVTPISRNVDVLDGNKRPLVWDSITGSKGLLAHPCQRKGQASRGDVINNVSLIGHHEKETKGNIDRRHGTKVVTGRRFPSEHHGIIGTRRRQNTGGYIIRDSMNLQKTVTRTNSHVE